MGSLNFNSRKMKDEELEEIFQGRYAKLNEEQREAVDSIEGSVMVVAGPGSGKTELLSLRVANILRETNLYPSSVLCLTFTESACFNMRERLYDIIGADAYRVAIHTFHSFSTEVIRNFSQFFYNSAVMTPADDLAQIGVLREIFIEMGFDNPLHKKHPEQGFTYLKAAKGAIGNLKKAGLLPDEFLKIVKENEKALAGLEEKVRETFGGRISKSVFPKIVELIEEIRSRDTGLEENAHIKPILASLADSLEYALGQALEQEKTTPITAWKRSNVKLDDDKNQVLKDQKYIGHMIALADVYKKYRTEMYSRGFIDFDDMLLDAISEIENNPSLRSELQERFLYVLVDEFQDTNDAQIRLLHLLTDSPVSEGDPNIMVVGDDDQAVYKFQGAKVSNVLDFKDKYRMAKFITLNKNYRSNQNILDLAREVIVQGEERLENMMEDIEKTLIAGNPNIKPGDILHKSFLTAEHEYRYIAREIRKMYDNGIDLSEVAVISRQHSSLESIVKFLQAEGVPINYERRQNVLAEAHIYQIVQVARFIKTLMERGEEAADYLLPEVLSYPFWGISREQIWDISINYRAADANAVACQGKEEGEVVKGEAGVEIDKKETCQGSVSADDKIINKNKTRKTWIGYMLESEDELLREVAGFLLDLRLVAASEPLEYVFDRIIGASNPEEKNEEGFVSPFKDYYFGEEKFKNNRAEYLRFLSSLNVFRGALREYKHGQRLKIEDMLEFVELHEKEGILITDTSSFVNSSSAVQLLTAHKAKGLEFENVFVINCQNDVWIGKGRADILPFPINMSITVDPDNVDDKLRLFFVALTRAKSNLYLTSFTQTPKGKESAKLQFLAAYPNSAADTLVLASQENKSREPLVKSDEELSIEILEKLLFVNNPGNEIKKDEKDLLLPLVERYKMSVTHLNNFLNVSRGGPQLFLNQNLLHFPQAKSESGAFGTAMHGAIQELYLKLQKEKELMSADEFVEGFQELLKKERLSDSSFEKYSEKGEKALRIYYAEKKDYFDISHKIEFDFGFYNVMMNGISLGGKIDKMIIEDDVIEVFDFKTGKVKESWKGKTPAEKIQTHNYKRQLVFYKILVENCRRFSMFEVKKGTLEFLEPKGDKIMELPYEIESVDVERLKKLIKIVGEKIRKLDFPDVSKYSVDLQGIIDFEDDLLAGNI